MSFRKLAYLKSFQPMIKNGLESFNNHKIKFISTYKAYNDKRNEYNDPTKYEHIVTNKFIPFFGWLETHEYKKK